MRPSGISGLIAHAMSAAMKNMMNRKTKRRTIRTNISVTETP